MALFVGMGELLGDGSRSAFPGYILPQSLSIDAAASFSNYIKSANLASIQENYADIAQWIYLSARGKQAGPLPEIWIRLVRTGTDSEFKLMTILTPLSVVKAKKFDCLACLIACFISFRPEKYR